MTPIPRLVTCEEMLDDDASIEGYNPKTGYSPEMVERLMQEIEDEWMSDPHS